MSDGGKDNVVDARARFAEAGAQRLRRVRGPGLLEQSGGELHPIHAEIQDLLDQIVDRAEIYEKTGRPDEAERLRAAVAEVIDDLMPGNPHRLMATAITSKINAFGAAMRQP